jgi:hypothetical protein
MFSKMNLSLGAACVAIALCSFVQSSPADEPLAAPATSSDDDDVDGDDKDDKLQRRRSRTSGSVVNADSGWRTQVKACRWR